MPPMAEGGLCKIEHSTHRIRFPYGTRHPQRQRPPQRGPRSRGFVGRLNGVHALQFASLAHQVDCPGGRDRHRGLGDHRRGEDRANPDLVVGESRTRRGKAAQPAASRAAGYRTPIPSRSGGTRVDSNGNPETTKDRRCGPSQATGSLSTAATPPAAASGA
jgi:hypothetical protein